MEVIHKSFKNAGNGSLHHHLLNDAEQYNNIHTANLADFVGNYRELTDGRNADSLDIPIVGGKRAEEST